MSFSEEKQKGHSKTGYVSGCCHVKCCKGEFWIQVRHLKCRHKHFCHLNWPDPAIVTSLQGSQEVLPDQELVPLPNTFPIWSDLEVSGLLPSPQGALPLSSPLLSSPRFGPEAPLAVLIVCSVATQHV